MEKANRKVFSSHWSLLYSVVFHAACAIGFYILTGIRVQSVEVIPGSGYFSIDQSGAGQAQVEPAASDLQENAENDEKSQPVESSESQSGNGAGNYWGTGDTAALRGMYSESTLGVKIKYPFGWTFLDQNIKNRLDGVTFLGSPTSNGQIPYIHLKVQEKYLFNPSRYKLKSQTDFYSAYYNEPEILETQYSQEVYLRTEKDYDYLVKLIVRGEQAFKEFQPVFFAMVKSFSFRQ